jgi:tyrosine-protein kinase Etk/Wzc
MVNMQSEASVLKMLVVLARRRRTIALGTIIATLVSVVLVLVIPVSYTGTAVIMAPQSSQNSAAALLSQLSSFSSLLPDSIESGFKSPTETYVGLISSRTVADELISAFDLQKRYRCRTLVETRKALAKHIRVEVTKGYLIRITVDDRSAKRAADMANALVAALYRLNKHLALSQASQRRVFLEQQVAAETSELNNAERQFKRVQEQTGVFQLSGQAELTLRAIAQLRAEIVSREMQLQQLRSIATEQNERVSELESGIAALREQLAKAEKSESGTDTSDYFLLANKVPSAGLEFVQMLRQVRYHEALFETLSKQYEAARIEEAKSPPLIQVVDPAIISDKRDWPPRTLLVCLVSLLSLISISAYALAKEAWRTAASLPANAEQLALLKSELQTRRGSQSLTEERG